ncbi:indolepyruvate ferredoxin oxidoreductase family protein [Janibacter sp. GS2]|uniref:indolepyruvate ferredoxin oxidoreductase family protein n=1 Tax=Janibacter sp. GS2 TaxID=3442646 RepID=UPI003EBCF387
MKLSDRLVAESGTHYLPGMQALIRFPLEQARRDRAAGLRIGTFICGYPGSPIGSLDLNLERIPDLLAEHDTTFLPAGNEELAMTAHMGTQMLDDHPHTEWDGVTSIWFGKGPGVDRSGDALKHGNFAGTSTHGAVVILSGEDHEAKSSTMPFQQEYAFMSAGVPVIYPSSVAEFRTFGMHAVAMSRFSGCWVSMKLTSALCDSAATVSFDPQDARPVLPDVSIEGAPFVKRTDFSFFPGKNIEMERHLYQERHVAVREYARANSLDEVVVSGDQDTIGIISAGKSYTDLRQALTNLGVTEADLRTAGVRILKLGLIYPIDSEAVRDFADDLERVIVLEEKRDVIEQQVRAALQVLGRPIEVTGKTDPTGRRVFPVEGGMDVDFVTDRLGELLGEDIGGLPEAPRLRVLAEIADREHVAHEARTPNFCSGCPHSASTVLAPGQEAWGAPGCNCFNTVIEQPERHIDVMTQMGGEGLPWVGLSRYTDKKHMVQHLGDGALYHSSYLNIRWAVATQTNITYKILYNGVLANTGAQNPVGQHGLADLTRGLESEGVQRIVILSKEPRQYSSQPIASVVEVRHADKMVETAAELEKVPGCTVMVYDESCANERRRLQKRGKLEKPTEFVVVNEEVCENCGDCGRSSNCMSLQKTPTEFGPKTRIHSSSCNQDFSCVKGDCPAFVTVRTEEGRGYRTRDPRTIEIGDLPEPTTRTRLPTDEPFHLYMPGVGGTGVLTLNGVLSVAAMLDGHGVHSFDQTGAAQKWGPVLSSLAIVPEGVTHWTSKTGQGQAHAYLALDEVGAAAVTNLERCRPGRTSAVLNSDLFPTGEQVRDVFATVDSDGLRASIAEVTDEVVEVRARWIADELFADFMLTNIIVVGTAYQHGLLPLSAQAIEEALRINGVAVERNIQAFRYGRLWAIDRQQVIDEITPPPTDAATELALRREPLSAAARGALDHLWARTDGLDEDSRRLLAVRLPELLDYAGHAAPAHQYLGRVIEVATVEDRVAPGHRELTHAVIRHLFKVMAYKDEYEVARLHLKPGFAEHIADTFQGDVEISYNLQPPLARTLGMGKIQLGSWFDTGFRALRAGRRLRETPFDPFAWQPSRVEERRVRDWYLDLVEEVIAAVSPLNHAVAVQLAELPDGIRGYEQVKHTGVVAAQERAERLREQLSRPPLTLTVATTSGSGAPPRP